PNQKTDRPKLTRANSIIGTPPYMAPEQHKGQPVDARTDQFAFCAALYEALYGVRPFNGDTYGEIAENAIDGSITPPLNAPGVSPQTADAIRRGLRPDPALRFGSMQELLAALAPPQRKKSPARWIAIGAGLALAVAVALFFALRSDAVGSTKPAV